MVKKLLLLGALLVLGVSGVSTSSVSANQSQKGQDQHVSVTICHRTDSATHPYVKITVDDDAVDGNAGNGKGNQPDHYGEHQGPLVTTTAEAQTLKDNHQKWGDIIPPVVGYHSGLNWTTEGQTILNNDCRLVGETNDDYDTTEVTVDESLDCDTKKVTITTTTTTITHTYTDGQWVAGTPVVTPVETTRDATTAELATCPDDGGEVLGTNDVKKLPYTGGDATLATVITLSTAAGVITLASLVARRLLSRQI